MHNLLLIEDSRTVAVIYKEIITNKLSKIGIDVNIIIVESYEEWNMIKDTIKIDTVIADWNLKYSTSENILLECMDRIEKICYECANKEKGKVNA